MTRHAITTALALVMIQLAISACNGDKTIASDGINNNIKSYNQGERFLSPRTYCPPEFSGRVPTQNCNGYVDCVNGVQALNIFECPPGTIFDASKDTCNWPDAVSKCSPYLAYEEGTPTEMEEENTDSLFCPAEFTGRAPISRCAGYVNCVYGEATSMASCQKFTAFDSKSQMCVSDLTECNLLVEVMEGMSDELINLDEEEAEPEADEE